MKEARPLFVAFGSEVWRQYDRKEIFEWRSWRGLFFTFVVLQVFSCPNCTHQNKKVRCAVILTIEGCLWLSKERKITMETTMAVSGDGMAFGAHPYALQGASVLTQISENLSGTFLGDLCKSWADSLVGANIEGMDVIKDCVSDLSDFYGVDNVKVFFEPGVSRFMIG